MNIWKHPTEDACVEWLDTRRRHKLIRITVPLGDSHLDLTPTEAKRMAKKILNDPGMP